MKTPRIYLYFSNPEFRGFIVPDLRSLVKDLGKLGDRTAFIHIGFRHIDSEEILSILNGLPPGVYCSDTFLGCDPGEQWKFSASVATVAKTNSAHFVSRSPVFERAEPIELKDKFVKSIHSAPTDRSHDKKRVVKDKPISSFDWSVRTANVFKTNNIEKLSDLAGLTENDFLSLPNFGRKSLAEIETTLAEIDLSIKDLAAREISFGEVEPEYSSGEVSVMSCSNFYDDIYARFLEVCEGRNLLILEKRIGAKGAPETLETVGNALGITRERVRQIENSAWKRALAKTPNPIGPWYYELERLAADVLFPLSVNEMLKNDHRFTDDVKNRELLRYLFRYFPKHGYPHSEQILHLVPYAGETFVTTLTENEVNELEDVIERRLTDSPGQREKAIKEGLWAVLPSARIQFAELIWRKSWSRALINAAPVPKEPVKRLYYTLRSWGDQCQTLRLRSFLRISTLPSHLVHVSTLWHCTNISFPPDMVFGQRWCCSIQSLRRSTLLTKVLKMSQLAIGRNFIRGN